MPVAPINSIRRRDPGLSRWWAVALEVCARSFDLSSMAFFRASEVALNCNLRSLPSVISWSLSNAADGRGPA